MKKLFLFSICVFTAYISNSQSKRIVVHSHIGLNFPGLGNLDRELRSANMLQTRPLYFSRGGGIYTIFPKVRLATLTTVSTYSGTRENNGQSSAVRGTQAGTALGLALVNNDRVSVLPYAGLAYTFFGVRSARTSPPDNTGFTQYLQGFSNQQHISSNQWAGNIGLQFSKNGIGNKPILENLVLGVKAGYFIPLGQSKWKTNETALNGGPKVNTGGFYTSFIIGISQ